MRKTRSGFLQEALGIWSTNGKGLYTGEMVQRCQALGVANLASIYCARAEDPEGEKAHYFCGIDPAKSNEKKSDDGAIVVLRALPIISELSQDVRAFSVSPCYAYKVRGADAPQWAAIVHRKQEHFGFTRICMDPGGGGLWIEPELKKEEQTIRGIVRKVRPIATIEDEQGMMIMADFILIMFRPRDKRIGDTWPNVTNLRWENLIDFGHTELTEAMKLGIISLPPPLNEIGQELTNLWHDEKRWASILVSDGKKGIGAQLMRIVVMTNDDGTIARTKTSTPARSFGSNDKKDFAYAFMMAYCAFLSWVRSGNTDIVVSEEDAEGCATW